MSESTPRITVKGLGGSIKCSLKLPEFSTKTKYFLVAEDSLEKLSGFTSDGQLDITRNDIAPGLYHVEAHVHLRNKYETFTSRTFSIGMNRQTTKPRTLRKSVKHQPPASFYSLLYWESRKAHNYLSNSAWLLDNKINAYSFADLLDIPTPALELAPVSADSLLLEKNTVIKPLNGVMSQGVFLINDEKFWI